MEKIEIADMYDFSEIAMYLMRIETQLKRIAEALENKNGT